jgi:hypothetical protein
MGDGMLMCYIYLFAYTISALKLSAVVMSGQKNIKAVGCLISHPLAHQLMHSPLIPLAGRREIRVSKK